jgi:NAD(P)H-flavin reductase
MAIQIPQRYQANIVANEQLAPTLFKLTAKAASNIPFATGQYCSFLIQEQRRPYSFASLPSEKTLQFIITTAPAGIGSTYVEALRSGDAIEFLAPYGRFTLQTDILRPLIFIATGAGIAPIRPLILEALQKTSQPITLLTGNYNEQYMAFHEEFSALNADQRITYIPTLSEPSENWQGARGYVTHTFAHTIKNPADFDYYICGNTPMMNDMLALLAEAHVPKEQIHREVFT